MQELLAERDFVRLLARQVLADGDAEDLVQDTWVAVLRRSPKTLQPTTAAPEAWETIPRYKSVRAGDRSPAVTTTGIGLHRLAETGRATLTDSHAPCGIAISAIGRFRVELAIETATRWVQVAPWNGWGSTRCSHTWSTCAARTIPCS